MADYNSSHTGLQIDEAIQKVLDKAVETSADKVSFTPGTTGLSANNVQAAIGELSSKISSGTGEWVSKGKKIVVGTSTAGWTENDCDYLCDGVADQETILQAIIAANNGEKVVYVLGGNYYFNEPLNCNTNTTSRVILIGQDRETVFQTSADSDIDMANSVVSITCSCIIENITFSNDDQYAIPLTVGNPGGELCIIKNCLIYTTGEYGFFPRYNFVCIECEFPFASVNLISDGGIGLFLNCRNTGQFTDWLRIEADNVSVINSHCRRANAGILLGSMTTYSSANYVNIIGNTFSSCSKGVINVKECIGVNIIGNYMFNSLERGVYAQMYAPYWNVVGNLFLNTPSAAIEFQNAQSCNISNNVLASDSGQYSIYVSGSKNVITSNVTPGTPIYTSGSNLEDNNSY